MTLTAPMTKREERVVRSEVREVDGTDGREFWARVLTYGAPDDFGTIWQRGCFNESLDRRMPQFMYGHAGWHDLRQVLGRAVEYRDTDDGLELHFRFDDFDAVPAARQAAAQISSGTLDEFSVGFDRSGGEWHPVRDVTGATERMVRATLDETSVVPRGAVHGTQPLSLPRGRSVRMATGEVVDGEFVIDLARRVAAGELSQAAAVEAIALAAKTGPDDDDDEGDDDADVELEPAVAVADAELDAEVAEALELVAEQV